MKLKNNNKSKSNKQKLYSKLNSKINKNYNNKTQEKFEDEDNNEDKKVGATTFEGVIDMISVSPSAKNKESVTYQDQLTDYIFLVLKYGFLVGILCLNFLGLSVSLNCNVDQELSQRILSAIFAFFFGFVYLIINYYTYKVLGQGKICKMDRDKLFPFRV
tara:strand:- start:668 stop:1147 length:480 start_codon:yes stop_codon:yes gene_type:complete